LKENGTVSMKIAILTTDNREHHRKYHLPAPYFGTAPEALLQGFAQLPEAEVHVISCTQRPFISSPEKLADNIFYHSLLVPKFGWLRTGYQGCIRAVRKKLKEIQPDIVHGQGTERECAMGAVLSGFPNVLTIHGNMREIAAFYRARIGNFYWLSARLEKFALRRTAGVFCNSTYTENLVRPVAAKTWRVPNPVRQKFFDTPISRQGKNVPVLLNVGILSPYKRQREILVLAGNLWRRGLKFQMQFAGDNAATTEYGASFMRELAAAEKLGYARHIGLLPTEKLISAMDAADALVHAPTQEAFGLVVAEALSRNLKLFGSATGGVADIAGGVEGVELFPQSDLPAMEQTIARWIAAGCPRPTAAAAVMRERYHPQIIAQRHMEIYREVLAANNKS
jgi:glycosyltransferase involved in cell wall biosynthesis